jgi:hypothetical protein
LEERSEMFEKILSKATASKSRNTNQRSAPELPRTRAFVEALVNHKHRITYAALADASELLGEHNPSGLSAGQRGSALVKALPIELQPHVCRSNGSYAKGTEWDCDVPGDLRNRAYVRPEAVADFVAQFEAATAEDDAQAEPEAIEEPEVDTDGLEIDPETGEPLA